MSIRYYADASMTSFREFTLTEFFDPRINRIWERSTPVSSPDYGTIKTIKGEDFLQILKGLSGDYTKGLIPHVFRGTGDWLHYTSFNEFKSNLIDCIPDHLQWVFYFIKPSRIVPSPWKMTVEYPVFSTEPLAADRSINWYTLNTIEYKTKTFNRDNAEAVFTEIANHYETVLTAFTGKLLGHINLYSNGSTFTKYFTHFIFNNLNYRTTTGNIHQPAVLTIDLDTSVTASHTDEQISQGYQPTFHITRKISKHYREPLYHILNYSTSPTSLLQWPIVEAHEKNPVLYGVELETASQYDVREIIDAQAIPFFIAKQDSSISGNGNTKSELVTIPMSLKSHKKHWAHWFKNIQYEKFDCTKDTNNGMHVHIDRKAFMNEHHLQNMVWFYTHPANTPFLVYISERGSVERMRTYSPIIQYPPSYTKVQSYRNCVSLARNARGIINLGKEPTIEIRMFRGIVSFGELVKNLEFVDAVFHFTEGEHSINKLSFSDFLVWLSKQPINRYTTLRKFIDLCNNLPDMIAAAEVKNIVFNLTDPAAVAKRLNESKIRITNAHISILNRGQKRKYILNKDTGLVDVTMTNRSKFAKIDRDIEARYTRHAIA